MTRPASALRALLGTCLFLLPAGPAPVQAQSASVVQVEEEWELLVAEPDPKTVSPQVSCTLSPGKTLDGWYAVWTVNYGNIPDFVPGGMQLQLWSGSDCVNCVSLDNGQTLAHANEVVHWTLRMSKTADGLVFEVSNGSSLTWGNFGSSNVLRLSVPGYSGDLNNYSADLSAANAEVGFGGNRVVKLVLKRVRYTLSDGRVWEDTTPRTIHQLAQ
ncbi:MAG: hypothetical protein KatS3mg110_0232 [Pirellulaceae bacterium]|nr:MAG: hypothetical protein KatS3mg110_0232 [Pirellulaceae bacterium]